MYFCCFIGLEAHALYWAYFRPKTKAFSQVWSPQRKQTCCKAKQAQTEALSREILLPRAKPRASDSLHGFIPFLIQQTKQKLKEDLGRNHTRQHALHVRSYSRTSCAAPHLHIQPVFCKHHFGTMFSAVFPRETTPMLTCQANQLQKSREQRTSSRPLDCTTSYHLLLAEPITIFADQSTCITKLSLTISSPQPVTTARVPSQQVQERAHQFSEDTTLHPKLRL